MSELSGWTCWLVHGGAQGDAVQCEGVASALGLDFVTKTIRRRWPWRLFAPWGPAAPDRQFVPPWPDLLIASGRHAIAYARMVRRRSRGRTYTVVLKNPHSSPADFDLVWAPAHDGLAGANVIATVTSPHPITEAALGEAAARFGPAFAGLNRPLVGVLVGGASGAFRFGESDASRLATDLAAFAARHGAGLAVACSRRTGRRNAARIAAELAPTGAHIWTGEGPNPYIAILALADVLVVTCESANMVGEATFTGRPVYLYRLPGGSHRFDRFHASVIERGWARWFDGSLEHWRYQPVNVTEEIADAVRAGLEARHKQASAELP